jgi:hypothetical protein
MSPDDQREKTNAPHMKDWAKYICGIAVLICTVSGVVWDWGGIAVMLYVFFPSLFVAVVAGSVALGTGVLREWLAAYTAMWFTSRVRLVILTFIVVGIGLFLAYIAYILVSILVFMISHPSYGS